MDAAERDGEAGWSIASNRLRPRPSLERLLFATDRPDVTRLLARQAQLEALALDLQSKLSAVESEPQGHVLFVPTGDGYSIIEADEPPPPLGQLLIVGDTCFRVHRAGRSPFPRDRRPCLFLERDAHDRHST